MIMWKICQRGWAVARCSGSWSALPSMPGASSRLGSCQGLIVCQGLLFEFMLAKPAAWQSSVCQPKKAVRDKRWRTCITVSGSCLLLCFGGSKDHTPVKRGGNLQRRRSRGRKAWLRALCAIYISLLVQCGYHPCQLLVKIQTDRSYLGQEAYESPAVPCLCQFLLAAHCACHWDSTCVSHRKCRYHWGVHLFAWKLGALLFNHTTPNQESPLRHRWEFRHFVVSYPLMNCLSYKSFSTNCVLFCAECAWQISSRFPAIWHFLLNPAVLKFSWPFLSCFPSTRNPSLFLECILAAQNKPLIVWWLSVIQVAFSPWQMPGP